MEGEGLLLPPPPLVEDTVRDFPPELEPLEEKVRMVVGVLEALATRAEGVPGVAMEEVGETVDSRAPPPTGVRETHFVAPPESVGRGPLGERDLEEKRERVGSGEVEEDWED